MVSVLRGVVDHGVAFTPQNSFQIPDLSAGEALRQQPLHAKEGSTGVGQKVAVVKMNRKRTHHGQTSQTIEEDPHFHTHGGRGFISVVKRRTRCDMCVS